MAGPNITPIFSKVGDIQWASADGDGGTAGPVKTANTAKDGTGTVNTIFTADATNGGFVQRIRFRAAGTNIATSGRIFINNGSSSSTIANNTLFDEITLSATTLSEVAALSTYELPENFALPPGYKLLFTIGTTVAAGWRVTAVGGKY